RLLDRFSDLHEMDKGDLGKYLRKFLSITSYLINESRLLDPECDAAFLRGFPQPICNRILARLAIKKPELTPGDAYTFPYVQAAALFVLEAGGITPPQANIQAQVPVVKSEPAEQGSIGELIQAMSSLTRVFTANAQSQQYAPRQARPPRPAFPTPGGVSQNPAPRWNGPPRANPDSFARNCLFCSSHDHFVKECPTAAQYLQRGQIMYDEYRKLALPDGRYPPAYLGGRNMKEQVDNYWKQQFEETGQDPIGEIVATNFLEGPDECVFSFDVQPPSPANDSGPSAYDDAIFEAQLSRIQFLTSKISHICQEIRDIKKARKLKSNLLWGTSTSTNLDEARTNQTNIV